MVFQMIQMLEQELVQKLGFPSMLMKVHLCQL